MDSSKTHISPTHPRRKPHRSFRRAVWRGLGIVLPPVLTVVIFLWIGGTINRYFLEPVNFGLRDVLARSIADVRLSLPDGELQTDHVEPSVYFSPSRGREYKRLVSGEYVPLSVYQTVRPIDTTATPDRGLSLYRRYVEIQYLQPYIIIPLTLIVFIVLMYLLGLFMAAGIGRVFWNIFERGIGRLPLVRNVYSSVKQVTDFMFTESEIEYTRVVAIEYPRKGIWSLGLVTGESLADITDAAGEPLLSLLIPSSPMPVTGYTITVRKSETIDLNITIDQAFQFCISCGVVVPEQQQIGRFTQPTEVVAAAGSASPKLIAPDARTPVSSATRDQR